MLQKIRDVVIIAVLVPVLLMTLSAIINPDGFGHWLQRMDTARFSNIDQN